MPEPNEAALDRQQTAPVRPMEGTVDVAPADPDTLLVVTLNAYGRRRTHEVPGWAPRGATDPAPGDTVWVQRADSGKLFVLAWHPA
ncbi:unannotated protein [freshwater metagenome]|uniref:Unannotated protein n=1 Tax=freshwater metagenome TaxID=449393 RepID=A0A6J7FHI7_9ZZZZ|nr:hypothetical protein [Actinomycetota bacterium]